MVTGSTPILAVVDVPAAIRFYTDVLGFPSSWMGGDPPSFGAANWGKARIMFSLNPDLAGQIEGRQIWLDVDKIDDLYARQVERGATIVSAIEDKPWGFREYTVRDPNGHELRFAGQPAHVSQGSGAFPPDVHIIRRMPTVEEFDRIADGAFGPEMGRNRVLGRVWRAVVAIGPNGDAIGMVRIMFDAQGWFSIWDVAVLPYWQGQRIGTAMMEEALAIVREEAPGSFVYLFTTKHPFYERLGFEKGTADVIKV